MTGSKAEGHVVLKLPGRTNVTSVLYIFQPWSFRYDSTCWRLGVAV